MTASPEELRLMLYEGAIKFCNQAKSAILNGKIEESYNGLMRAQKIVLELSTSLNHSIAPDLCEKLSALYTYIYRLLVDANMNRELKPLEEAIKLLQFERGTWELLMKKLAETDSGDRAAAAADLAGAQQTAITSLSQSA